MKLFKFCISIFLIIIFAEDARACRITIKPLQERVSESDLIVTGSIIEVEKLKHPTDKTDHVATVAVDDVFKGGENVRGNLKVYFLVNGWDKCKPGTQHFSAGKRKKKLKELFFLRKFDDGYFTSAEFTGGFVGFSETKEYLKRIPDLLKGGSLTEVEKIAD